MINIRHEQGRHVGGYNKHALPHAKTPLRAFWRRMKEGVSRCLHPRKRGVLFSYTWINSSAGRHNQIIAREGRVLLLTEVPG